MITATNEKLLTEHIEYIIKAWKGAKLVDDYEFTKRVICKDCELKKEARVILEFFKYKHLPEKLQEISKPFWELAAAMDNTLPDGSEKSAGLRKLLEAKDCMVRAAL